MLWFDGLLSVPGIGVRIKPNYKEANVFNEKMIDFIEYLSEEYDDLEIKKKEIWGYSISSKKSSFSFDIARKDIVVQCSYSIVQEPQAGKLPKFVMPEVKTCSELFNNIFEYIQKIFEVIKDIKGFKYDRIGIFSDINIDEESIPPGVAAWIKNLSKTLAGELSQANSMLLMKLNETEGHHEQCHHFINFDQSSIENGYHLKLDWQRVYDTPILLTYKSIIEDINICKREAFTYFQKFGEGGLYDD